MHHILQVGAQPGFRCDMRSSLIIPVAYRGGGVEPPLTWQKYFVVPEMR